MSGKRNHLYILIGLIVGATAGIIADWYTGSAHGANFRPRLDWFTYNITDLIGKIFLRLIFMVVVPLVFSALALGVVEIGDVRKLGRIGLKTLGYTLLLSMTAVIIGIASVNIFKPGASLSVERRDKLRAQYAGSAEKTLQNARAAKTVRDTLLDIVPENPLQEMVGALDGSAKGGGMLAVMFFALIFGIALTMIAADRATSIVALLQAVFDTCMVIIGITMRLAPLAVACLLFSTTSRVGGEVLKMLLGFALTALCGMLVHLLIVYPLFLWLRCGVNPIVWFRKVSDVMVTAFATSSSSATLPTALRCAKEDLHLPKEIAHFVLTVGATGNQNGTALYEGVVVLFLAQVFGVDLSLGQQLTVVFMAILAGVGTAGVPGGSLPMIAVLCGTIGVPPEGIGIILGVDRILDMSRTVLNVVGDLVLATCVSKGQVKLAALR